MTKYPRIKIVKNGNDYEDTPVIILESILHVRMSEQWFDKINNAVHSVDIKSIETYRNIDELLYATLLVEMLNVYLAKCSYEPNNKNRKFGPVMSSLLNKIKRIFEKVHEYNEQVYVIMNIDTISIELSC